jgi:hypothetical protein
MSSDRLESVDLALNLTESHRLWIIMLNLVKMIDSLLLSAKYFTIFNRSILYARDAPSLMDRSESD